MRGFKKNIWILTLIIALILSVLTFTPVIIPKYRFMPELLGMPYTLWTGVLLMIAFILNTLAAIFVHPGNDNEI